MIKVIVSAAISLDGYLDDCTEQRLRLSSDEDWQAVLRLRAQCDAILVGAGTLRSDNPSLVIRDPDLRKMRLDAGMNPDITKVTLTRTGCIEPQYNFFTQGLGNKIVFTQAEPIGSHWEHIGEVAEVVHSEVVSARTIVEQMEQRGCKRLMVEGGSRVLTMFFEQGMVDEFRLAVAPFFVGDEHAPRLVCGGVFPYNALRKMSLEQVEMLGDTVVMKYRLDRKNTIL